MIQRLAATLRGAWRVYGAGIGPEKRKICKLRNKRN